MMFDPAYAINAGSVVHMATWKMAKDACDALGGARGKRYFAKFYDIMLVTHQGQYLDVRLTKEIKDITKFTLRRVLCLNTRKERILFGVRADAVRSHNSRRR